MQSLDLNTILTLVRPKAMDPDIQGSGVSGIDESMYEAMEGKVVGKGK